MTRLSLLICLTISAVLSTTVSADFSGKAELKNNLVFRGVQRSTNEVIPLGNLQFSLDGGWYFGVNATTVDFSNGEISGEEATFFAGFSKILSPQVSVDASVLTYQYAISQADRNFDWYEAQLRLNIQSRSAITLGLAESWLGLPGETGYLEFSYLMPLTSNLSFQPTVGAHIAENSLGENFGFAELGVIYSIGSDLYARLNLSTNITTIDGSTRNSAGSQTSVSLGYLF